MNNKEMNFYTSPEAEVVETQAWGAILATSDPNSTDPYERDLWDDLISD